MANASCVNDTWKKYTISISDYISLLDNERNIALIKGDVVGLTNSYLYFGEITFEKIVPTILTVTEDTAAKIIRGTVKGSYLAAGADEIKDFAGDYTGGASKITSAVGQNCFVKTSYTADEIRAVASKYGYTHISMWMAVSSQLTVGSGGLYIEAGGSAWNAIKTTNTWVKYTVTIDDFIGQLSGGQVKLINFQTANVNVYFGDITFETTQS